MSGAVKGTVTFQFSATPVATSSWCVDGCQSPGRPRCCIRLEPGFDLFRLLAGMRSTTGYRGVISAVRCTLSAKHLVLTVHREQATGYCGLWTPTGCRLPVEAKPDPCRHYVCKVDLFRGNPEAATILDEYNRFRLALAEHEPAQEYLTARAKKSFRSFLHGCGTHQDDALTALLDALEALRTDHEEYLARRDEFVQAYLGTNVLTLTVNV